MQRLQQTINQKFEGLVNALSAKDQLVLKTKIQELSAIQPLAREQMVTQLHAKVKQIVPPQSLQRYRTLQLKLKSNNQTLEIVNRGRKIVERLQQYLDLDPTHELDKGHVLFAKVLDALNHFEQLVSFSYPDFGVLREQLYIHISAKISKNDEESTDTEEQFNQSLKALELPLKKNETRTQKPYGHQRYKLLTMMHREHCLITLKRQICSLLEKEDHSEQKLLQLYWQPSVKTVLYLFVSGTQLHNLEEPGWMFEYLQHILNANYKYFCDFVLARDLRPDVTRALNNYFLSGTIQFLFLKAIETRLKDDLALLNPFLSFNFLDQVSGLQVKLHNVFGLGIGILQKILLKYQRLLDSSFEYENERFETKIFEDFLNINYSRVNLKNLEPYNLMMAFLNMLERLNSKYRLINHPDLKKKIAKFYRDKVMVLVAHLKTSIDRIYNHSGLPKLDILVSFKRTQNQLRSSLAEITLSDPELDQRLHKEYYCFLEKYYQAAALQALTPVHKKIHISFADIMNRFNSADDTGHDQLFLGFAKIQQQWLAKMDQILKFSNYVDNKLKAIFFTYLQAIKFSSVGLNLYLKIFEPFLQYIFTEERHRTLISLITTSKQRFDEYMEAHPSAMSFLSADQLTKLTKFKKAHSDL